MNARILWQNKDAVQTYRIGNFHADPPGSDMPIQEIDFLWSRGGTNNAKYLSSPDHVGKIEVRGPDCVQVAERIVKLLNQP